MLLAGWRDTRLGHGVRDAPSAGLTGISTAAEPSLSASASA